MEAQNESQFYRAIPVVEQRPQPSLADDLRAIVAALGNRWRLILLCMLVASSVGVGYLWFTAPTYESNAEILLDPRERKLVDNDVVAGGLGSSSQGADASQVESQVEILKSRSVLTALIAQQDLENDPDFGGGAGRSSLPVRLAKTLLYGPNSPSYLGQSAFDRAMTALVDAIKVERVGNTYVLRITVAAAAPEKAAALANGLAELYLAEGQSASRTSSEEAAAALEARLAELGAQSDDAQRAVEQYRADNGLLGADGILVDEQQLRDLNDQVTKASIDTQAARSKLDEVQRLAAEPLSATAGSSILSSTVVEDLRAQLDTARAEETSLSGIYGARHPLLIAATEKRRALENGMADEIRRIASRIESDYEQALKTESSLNAMLSQAETRRAASNNASIQLRELERRADSTQQLFETFSVRASEIREQTDLPTNNARIISPAIINSQPTGPRLVLSLSIALALGLIIGVTLAWLLHLLNGTPDKPVRRPQAASVPAHATPVRPRASSRSASIRQASEEIVAAQPVQAKTTYSPQRSTRQRLLTGLFR